jgi:branched-chain amino acid transport system ATP-binding protein
MALLAVENLDSFYGDFQALFAISASVDEGETVAIIGSNGAGKSTFLKSITGMLDASRESIRFGGEPIGGLPVPEIVKRGIAMVPEGRRLFPSLTVEENLLIGGYGRTGSGRWSLKTLYELFPVLGERRSQPSTALSGGQQQMVAIARALMSNPKLLLCDEISLGLAPVVIKDIYAALPAVKAEGTAIVVVEQDIIQAMKVSDRVYCFSEGRMTLTGAPAELSQEAIHAAYFGH